MEERTLKERQMEGERIEKQKIELIHKLEAHNQAMNGSLIGVGRTEAQRCHHPLPEQMQTQPPLPLQDHTTEIRGLKESLENTCMLFDKFAQDVLDRLATLEMKVG